VNGIPADVWSKLTGTGPVGENLTARIAVPTITERLLAAIDIEGRRHLLIPLKPDDEDLRDIQSRGIRVETRQLTVHDLGTTRYIDFICLDSAGHGAFDLIAGELASGLRAGNSNAAKLGSSVLSKWRRFWALPLWQTLSREAQLGLFAELWFFSVWLIPKVGGIKALAGWRGPFGARHDFEWPGRSVEVKGTTSNRGRAHRINGLDQLLPPETGELLFFSLRLREEGGAINNLPGVIASCRNLLDGDALDRFESALAQVGYSPAHDEEYAKLKLRVVGQELFRVEGNFPRITPESFAAGLPSGIERVEYEINLSGFDHLRTASSPDGFNFE